MTLVSFNACMAKTMASGGGNWDKYSQLLKHIQSVIPTKQAGLHLLVLTDDLLRMYARGAWALAYRGVRTGGWGCKKLGNCAYINYPLLRLQSQSSILMRLIIESVLVINRRQEAHTV
jgi:hypothetical protein